MGDGIQDYTRENCPVCGHRGWCGRRSDGLVLCKRPPEPRDVPGYSFQGIGSDNATGMYVEKGREHTSNRVATTRSFRKSKPTPANMNEPESIQVLHAKFVEQFVDDRRQALAEVLKLPLYALDALDIGWCSDRRWWNPETQQEEGDAGCWTFSECNAQGRVIGIGLRFQNSKKGQITGGKRGLTLPNSWKEKPDPIIVAEGPSDVIAGCHVGLNVIGRPNNSGGAELLLQLLRNRKVITLGENDRKPDGTWPGSSGAKAVASKLQSMWERPVPVAFPPDGAKDLREWFLCHYVGRDQEGLKALGVEFLRTLNIPEVQFLAGSRSRRSNRVVVKAFRWTGNVADEPIHTDRIDPAESRDRKRFAKAIAQQEPNVDTAELELRLAKVEVPTPRKRVPAFRVAHTDVQAEVPSDGTKISARLRIQSNERQLHHIRDDAVKAVLRHNQPPRLFSRDSEIVRVVSTRDSLGQAVPIIQSLDDVALRGELSNAADWYLIRRTRNGEEIKVDDLPPMAVARDLLKLPQSLLPPLQGIIHCPTFTVDGSLILNAGYDAASGLWHHLTLTELLPVPERPSAHEITQARDLLLDLFVDFPFVDESSSTNALSLLLLAFARPLITGPTPCYAIDAPTAGTGKDLLAKAATIPALGHEVGAMTEARESDEWRKKITAALAGGNSVILWGNIAYRLDNEHFAAVLTEMIWRDRELGSSRNLVLPNRAIWIVTGNNLSFSKEITRRVVWIRLDSKLENPETRSRFKHTDLLSHVRDQRAQVVRAALILIRAWLAAGRPMGTQVMGSFESYARVMGGILDVAGVPGFLGNADTLRQRTHGESSEWRAFVLAWWERWKDGKLRVNDLAKLLWDGDFKRTDLLITVVTSSNEHGAVTQLGRRLAAKRDSVIGGFRIVSGEEKDHCGRLVYHLEPCAPQALATNGGSLREVCTEVCTHKSSNDKPLDESADFRILFPGPSACAREHYNANSDACVNGAHICREEVPKKSAKVCTSTQPAPPHELTVADLPADFVQASSNDTQMSAVLPFEVQDTWCKGNASELSRELVALTRVRDGWTSTSWRNRLLQLADTCESTNPDRAVELRQAAAMMSSIEEQSHDA